MSVTASQSIPHTFQGLPEGIDSVRVTLKCMVKLARMYKSDVDIIDLARKIITQPQVITGTADRIRALQRYVRDKISYVPDPLGQELVQTPKRTLDIKTGDCDDKSVLLASLLLSIGIPARFFAVGLNGGPYSHVLVQARCGKSWVDLETILPGIEAGWSPPNVTRWMFASV